MFIGGVEVKSRRQRDSDLGTGGAVKVVEGCCGGL
jgi:hypothetical protein